MTTYPENVDVVIHAGEWATVWQFEPVSAAANDWIADNLDLEDWQIVGKTFAVDHREARRLASHLCGEGFTLWHPEYGFHRENIAA